MMDRSNLRDWLLTAGAVALAAALCCPWSALADTYVFDKDHTNVSFSWGHLGLSRQSGRILDVDGTLEFDSEDPEKSSVDVVMRVASIRTGVDALDKQLRTADFFDAARNPVITFKSSIVRKASDKTGEVAGDLTMMGITKPVVLQVTWNYTGEHPLGAINPNYKDKTVSGFSAETRINRTDWGISRGTPLISDEIRVTIEAELLKK